MKNVKDNGKHSQVNIVRFIEYVRIVNFYQCGMWSSGQA